MSRPVSRLLVNLSASQTRKRLKGYGFGVRKVQASDRNQCVITHTATGQHERELRALFADVLPPTAENKPAVPDREDHWPEGQNLDE